MAEVLGVFASGIAVAQLAGSIVASSKEMYTFWANVKDAPKNVTDLITEIELLGKVLQELHDKYGAAEQNNSAAMGEIVTHCHDVMKELGELLRKMEDDMRKSKGKAGRQWNGAKVALKGHIVQDLINRLERVKSLLTLANSLDTHTALRSIQMGTPKPSESRSQQVSLPYPAQANVTALSTASLVIGPSKVTRILIEGKMTACNLGIYRYLTYALRNCNTVRRSSNGDDNIFDNEIVDIDIEILFVPKAWLKIKAVSIKQTRRFGQWKFSCHSICVIPNDSPIFTACTNGDQNEVIRLIKEKKGSVFDVNEEGWTLLHIAAANMRHELCLWLLLNGARSGATGTRIGWTALHIAAEFSGRPTPAIENYGKNHPSRISIQYQKAAIRPAEEVLDTIRVLVEHGQCDPMVECPVTEKCEERSKALDHRCNGPLDHCCNGPTALDIYSGPPEAFKYLLEQDKFVVSVGSSHWRNIMERNFGRFPPFGTELATIATTNDENFKKSLHLKDGFPDFSMPLHATLSKISSAHLRCFNKSESEAAISMASLLLQGNIDVHRIDETRNTPFSQLFGGLDLCHWPSDAENLAHIVMIWFRLLRKANYDLQDYLKRESCLHKPIQVFKFPHRKFYAKYIRLDQMKDSRDMMFFFEMYDYRREFARIYKERVNPGGPEDISGAWKSEDEENFKNGLNICTRCIVRPTDRVPDFGISFRIGELKHGIQQFGPIDYMRRRLGKSKCICYYGCNLHKGELDNTPAETHEHENVVALEGQYEL